MIKDGSKIVAWFSCGNASAINTKLLLETYPNCNIVVARCVVPNEHPDNDRFSDDCEKWFGVPILKLQSSKFKDCWEVWEKKRYLSGIRGAPCTIEMKKAVRWEFEKQFDPAYQSFGFTSEEKGRAERFIKNNPEIKIISMLIENGVSKDDCHNLVAAAGIKRSILYDLGFANANCTACVKVTTVKYWAKVKKYFPEEFARMDELSTRLKCRLILYKGKRIYLHEIPDDVDPDAKLRGSPECSILCSAS